MMGAPRTIGWAVVVALLWSGCVRAGFGDLERPQVVDGGDLGAGDARRDRSAHDAAHDAMTPDAAQEAMTPDLGGCVQQQQTLQVNADVNDGEIDYDFTWRVGGEVNTKGDPPGDYMGYWTDWTNKVVGPTWSYFRYKLTQAIPATATAVDGHLHLHGIDTPVSSAGWESKKHALRAHVEDAADADPVTVSTKSPESASGRAIIAPPVRWPAVGGLVWNTNGYNQLTTLGPPLQALILKRGGLAAGAHVQIWIRGDFSQGSAEVATPDIARPNYKPAKLTISWCE